MNAVLVLAVSLVDALAVEPTSSHNRAQAELPAALVYLREVDDTIIQDIRYATSHNFTGKRVDGYEAAECILTRKTAGALKAVQSDLATENLSLKVYDCYRPERAVRSFIGWSQLPDFDDATSKRFYPGVQRKSLLSLGFIATASGHSRADTVDVTLVTVPSTEGGAFDTSRSYGDCTAPMDKREPDNSVDMGTSFDCFDSKSQTSSTGISSEQRHWRQVLLRAMERRGFRNYGREWWHFTYGVGKGPTYDFPIKSMHMN